MKNVTVYCGSQVGTSAVIEKEVRALAKLMAENEMRLIYGGGNIGLMGIMADEVLAHGGEVIGIIPQFLLDREVAHPGLTELQVVDSMHVRKMQMAELGEAFLALPGGMGTLEELTEIITWWQLRLHQYPIGILNADGYYDHLLEFFKNMYKNEYCKPSLIESLIVEATAEGIVKAIS